MLTIRQVLILIHILELLLYLDPNKRERQILKALLVKALKWY